MIKGKRNKLGVWLAALCALSLGVGLVACAPQANSGDKDAAKEAEPKQQVETPAADSYGVVTAESWKDIYPDQYKTYVENEANSPDSGKHNYLELYPALNTMYKGYAFALGYEEASSHSYSLQSVKETPRTIKKEQMANCISCKTPQFTALVNNEGPEIYKQPFNDTIGQFTENISCWNCHENDPSTLTVGNKFFLAALDADATSDKVPVEAQVCGQCHNEYYFEPETKATTNPYMGLDEMTPEAILAYFDEKGFKDWEHPDTGAAMLKVQHPEFETIYGGEQSNMAKQGYACGDCHMAPSTGESGDFASHTWASPLENDQLIEDDCSKCHADIKKQVAGWQDTEETRVIALSEKIEQFINKVAEQKAAGSLADDQLAQLQKTHRTAQFYWDFIMVENSEGAHNYKLTADTLDKAEAAIDEGLALLA